MKNILIIFIILFTELGCSQQSENFREVAIYNIDQNMAELPYGVFDEINFDLKLKYTNHQVIVFPKASGYGVVICSPLRTKLKKSESDEILEFVGIKMNR